jgi:predicted glycogen debranching enzyme
MVAEPDSERRYNLVNGLEAWLDSGGKSFALSSHRYAPDTVHPDGAAAIADFKDDPWPTWRIVTPAGDIEFSISGTRGHSASVLRWRLSGGTATLRVRLHMSGRDWHALQRENTAFRFQSEERSAVVRRFRPYDGVPTVVVIADAEYRYAPLWFRNCQYDEERARGQDFIEDLASPGEFMFSVGGGRDAVMILSTDGERGGIQPQGADESLASAVDMLRAVEGERREALSPRERVAEPYLVRRGQRSTIIAGYPWFTDWGRDAFISVRGLCIATGRLADAEAILSSWCEHLSQGMMPNLFPSGAGKPEYNSVDASLWFIIAVHDLAKAASGGAVPQVPLKFIQACDEILTHYSRGTRHNIRMDGDGLLAAGEPGVALTWMDAIVDGKPVTPRIGKAVEVQALWINALEFAATWNTRWRATAAKAREAFAKRFWNEKRKFLYDVVDVDHVAGATDDRLRPNQIFACGGLPQRVLDDERAEAVSDVVRRELWTPAGVRTLGRGEPGYIGRVDGALRQRDLGYHQGTAWPWLAGALPGAVFEGSHEIADGDEPHERRGCPFQAWTVGEAIRMLKA